MRANTHNIKQSLLAVCGPTASGKSELTDSTAEEITRRTGRWTPTIVVDSMQVYRELPKITNQERRRRASLVGVVSVTQEWSVADHRERADEIVARAQTPVLLDAGTGMYLNALILGIPLAPRVPAELRSRAIALTAGAANPRRAARAKELELAGAGERGSIWEGDLRYEVSMVYLRPDRASLDAAIAARSSRIARTGVAEARAIAALEESGAQINPSVRDSIGVKELVAYVRGEMPLEEAERQIGLRTRRLARRQIRWFDKLARTIQGRAPVVVAESAGEPAIRNTMHDIIGT